MSGEKQDFTSSNGEEPFFLVNEFLEKEKNELEGILEVVKRKNMKHFDRAALLKNFTEGMFYASLKKAHGEKKSLEEEKKKLREELLKRKQELIKIISEREKKKGPAVEIKKKPGEKKEIIKSRVSGKTFVAAEFSDGFYTVKEPELKPHDMRILAEIKKLDIKNEKQVIKTLKEACVKNSVNYSENYYDIMRYYLIRDKRKFGRITPLIEDRDVTEIVCTGPNKRILITYKGKHDIPSSVIFDNDEQINTFVKNMAQKANEKLSPEKPFFKAVVGSMAVSANIGTKFIAPKFVIIKEKQAT